MALEAQSVGLVPGVFTPGLSSDTRWEPEGITGVGPSRLHSSYEGESRPVAAAKPLRAILLVALLGLLGCMAISDTAQAVDPTIAAVGDMACSPTNPSYNDGNGTATRCRQKYVSDLLVSLGADRAAGPRRQPVRQRRAGELPGRLPPDLRPRQLGRLPEPRQRRVRHAQRAGLLRLLLERRASRRGSGTSGADTSNFSSGYYSFDIGAWHLIALNSNCGRVGGCGTGSPQEMWLKSDLAAHPEPVHARLLAPPALELRRRSATTPRRAPSGPTSTTPTPTSCSTATATTTTSATRPRPRRRARRRERHPRVHRQHRRRVARHPARRRRATRTRSRSPTTRASGC